MYISPWIHNCEPWTLNFMGSSLPLRGSSFWVQAYTYDHIHWYVGKPLIHHDIQLWLASIAASNWMLYDQLLWMNGWNWYTFLTWTCLEHSWTNNPLFRQKNADLWSVNMNLSSSPQQLFLCDQALSRRLHVTMKQPSPRTRCSCDSGRRMTRRYCRPKIPAERQRCWYGSK
jgi:hypothetical protein